MKELYTAVMVLTIGSMIIMQAAVAYNVTLEKERKRATRQLFWVITITSFCEWAGVMLDGLSLRHIPMHWAVKAIELSLTPCIGLLCGRSLSSGQKGSKMEKIAVGLVAAHALLEVSSIFTKQIFYVDAANVYHHGPYYWIYTLFCAATIGFFFVRGLQTFRRYQHSGGVLIWMVTIYLIAGIVTQAVNSQIKITWPTVALSAVMLYKFYGDVIQQVDGLTELINRWGYENYLSHFQGRGAIVFLDVDDFKEINDTYGHAVGDHCLLTIANCLRGVFGPYGKCFRVGGDEFCVVLEEKQNEVTALLKTLSEKMKACREADPRIPYLSAGYVVFDTREKNVNDAVMEADEQMYQAKRQHHADGRV